MKVELSRLRLKLEKGEISPNFDSKKCHGKCVESGKTKCRSTLEDRAQIASQGHFQSSESPLYQSGANIEAIMLTNSCQALLEFPRLF